MAVDAREEVGNLVTVTVEGRLATVDQAALVYFITKALERHGGIRLLVLLQGFAGWEEDDQWADDGIRLPDDAAVTKAAFVGDPGWQEPMLLFVSAPFRGIPIEYFESEATARAWLEV